MNRATLIKHIKQRASFLCIGLDTDISKLPKGFSKDAEGIVAFNRAIIAATQDYCVAYKPNTAFYETLGSEGWAALETTMQLIPDTHFVIADAKRGDIGNTARQYASAFFDRMHCDAVTVAPYMGQDSVAPFLSFPDKWAIVLALTSNAGAADFQYHGAPNPLFELVLQKCQQWGNPDNLMFVVGATQANALARIRQLAPDHFLLVPGVGAQGGSLSEVAQFGLNNDIGLLVNASRSIIFADSGPGFAKAAALAAQKVQQEMRNLLVHHKLL